MSEREQRPRRRGKASDQQNASPPAKTPQTSHRGSAQRSAQRPGNRPPPSRRGGASVTRKADPDDKAPRGYYLPDFDELDDLDDLNFGAGMDEGLEPEQPPKPAKRPQQQKAPAKKPAAPQAKAAPAKPQQAQKQPPKPQPQPQAGRSQAAAKPQPQAARQPQPQQPKAPAAKQPQPTEARKRPEAQPSKQPEGKQPEAKQPPRPAEPQAKPAQPKPAQPKPAQAKQPQPPKPEAAAAQKPAEPRRPAQRQPAEKRSDEPKPAESRQPAEPKPPRKREPRPAAEASQPLESKQLAEPKAPRKREPRPGAEASQPAAAKPARTQPNAFARLGVSKTMLASLDAAGYLEPTPVQEGVIPRALEGVDVMGQARTGTGKTAAFAIPILEKIETRGRGAMPQALVLVPTRELAVQVRDECGKLAFGRDVRIAAVYGGKPIRKQAEELHRGVDFVVGTPGRVIDMTNRGLLDFRDVRYVVLDEADRMLDIGFRPDIEKILRRCPESRQTLLLSATIAPPVKRLAERYMREPEMLDFSANDLAVETIDQYYFSVDPERKFDLLIRLLEREEPRQAIIFCRTKRGTDRLQRRLSEKFTGVGTIHGDLAQSARDRVMAKFREGRVRYLVATDVVGRGIDVSAISHIINFDIPAFCDDYVHRVGRTGRMGREGVAYTFVSPEEGNELTRIEMRINILLERDEIPGFSSLAKPQPTGDLDEPVGEEAPPVEAKPVYGKPIKRYRRAL